MTGLVGMAALSRVSGVLHVVPRWVWLAGAGLALLQVGSCVHERKVEALVEATREARDAEWQAAFDDMRAAANQWRENYQTAAAQISVLEEKRHAQELRLNAARADDLRLRGPGRATARCGPVDRTVISTPAGGPDAASGGPDAPLAPVPADEPLAILPWNDLVRRARDADDNRAEVESWRTWYVQQRDLNDTARREIPVPTFGQE